MFTWNPKWTQTGLKSQTALKSNFVYMAVSIHKWANQYKWPLINNWRKNNNDLKQECCIRFIMFHKFSQGNKSRQSSHISVTFRLKLDCLTIQDKDHLIHLRSKSQQNWKITLIFDNTIYQTIAIFPESSGFLEWEPVSSNSERYIV